MAVAATGIRAGRVQKTRVLSRTLARWMGVGSLTRPWTTDRRRNKGRGGAAPPEHRKSRNAGRISSQPPGEACRPASGFPVSSGNWRPNLRGATHQLCGGITSWHWEVSSLLNVFMFSLYIKKKKKKKKEKQSACDFPTPDVAFSLMTPQRVTE